MNNHIVVHHIVTRALAVDHVHTNPDISLLASNEAAARALLEAKSKAVEAVLTKAGLPLTLMRSDEPVGGEMEAHALTDARYRMTKGWYLDIPVAHAAEIIDTLFALGFEFNNLIEFRANHIELEAAYVELEHAFADEGNAIIGRYAEGLALSLDDIRHNGNRIEDSYGGVMSAADGGTDRLHISHAHISGVSVAPIIAADGGGKEGGEGVTVCRLASAPQDWIDINATVQCKGPQLAPLMVQTVQQSHAAADALIRLGISPADIFFQTIRVTQTRPDPVFPEGVTSLPTPAPDGFEVLRSVRYRLRDVAQKASVLAELEKAGLLNGFVLLPGCDKPQSLHEAARTEAIAEIKKKIKNDTIVALEEQDFFQAIYAEQLKDSAGKSLKGRARGGVCVTLRLRSQPLAEQ